MIKAIVRIVLAIKCALDERNRQRKQFKQKQSEIYKEGFTESKLREQLNGLIAEMYEDPSIVSVKISISKEALPFISGIIPTLQCEVNPCASPTEYILTPLDTFV